MRRLFQPCTTSSRGPSCTLMVGNVFLLFLFAGVCPTQRNTVHSLRAQTQSIACEALETYQLISLLCLVCQHKDKLFFWSRLLIGGGQGVFVLSYLIGHSYRTFERSHIVFVFNCSPCRSRDGGPRGKTQPGTTGAEDGSEQSRH